MTTPIRVLIADDHAPTRADLREAIEQDERFTVVAEAADGAGAIEAALRERPDLCLLDIRMPGSGIAVTREVTTRLPETKVVMITVSVDDDDLLNALRAGASGYMLKDCDLDRLPHALMDTLNGGTAIPRRLMSKIVFLGASIGDKDDLFGALRAGAKGYLPTRGATVEGLRRALEGVLRGEAAIPRELVALLVDEFREYGPRRRALVGHNGHDLTSREWEVLDLLRQGLSTNDIADRLFISAATVRSHVSGLKRKLGVSDREALLTADRSRDG